MKEAIRQRALELGFDACRFTTAAAPESAPLLVKALSDGRHGEMVWLAKNAEKRIDIQRVLPGAASVVILAASYHNPAWDRSPPSSADSPRGVVARYARSDDYHEVLGGKLKALSQFVDNLGGAECRSLWYVDTGPILERDLAQRAGLGFIGKHTNLISRQLGNWFFLAEILTTAAVEPDLPERNHCGSCTRCLSACPTAAIPAPFVLDARRCISYLTIELKGSIPLEFRPLIGNRIYGCDDCLAACPWNRFAREGALMRPHRRADLDQPALLDLLQLDDARFRERFRNAPIYRTKRRGLLRNVCVALGNTGDATALPVLEKAAADREPLIAEHAAWAIERVQSRKQGEE